MASKLFIFLCVVVLAILVPRIIMLVRFLKPGKVIYNHQPGPCQLIKGIEQGSEDMQALPNGMVFISAGLRFYRDWNVAPWKDIKGEIRLFDIHNPEKGAVPLQIQGSLDLKLFNPHGISIWRENDKTTLFVVNHPPDEEFIELFSFDEKNPTVLVHLETIASESILFPNDVVAVGPRQFYVTNYMKFKGHGILNKLETFTMLHLGNVVYYDGQDGRIVADGLMIANGINVSPDGKYIYVMSVGDDELRVYERQSDNGLVIKQAVKVGAADNIDVDPVTGDLWLGVHPKPIATLDHLEDPRAATSPSQALHLTTKGGLVTDLTEVYSDDGSRFVSGSSVALRYQDRLLVGTVQHRAVMCQILYPH